MATRVLRSKEIKISLYALAAITLVAGYADLARGGITASAVLLSLAYCASHSARHLERRAASDRRTSPATQPSYGIAALAALGRARACISSRWRRRRRCGTRASTSRRRTPSVYRIRRAIRSSSSSAGSSRSCRSRRPWRRASTCWPRSAAPSPPACGSSSPSTWCDRGCPHDGSGSSPACSRALIGATAFTVWNQSVVNEKVYTVSLAGIALVSWLAVRWSDRADGPRADRALVMIAYLCGLGYANHMAGMLPAPAIATLVLLRRPATLFRWKLLLACLVALFVGVTPFATQPIRAAFFPVMNEGEPTACRVKLEWSCTMSKATYDAFMYNFNRGQYGKPNLSDRQASFGEQVGMWWLYFRWQWLRDVNAKHPFLQSLLGTTFLDVRPDRRVDSLPARSPELLVFRNAHVHDDAAAHLLSQLQAGMVAGSGVAGRAGSSGSRLLLPLELFGVGRLGGGRPDVHLGVGGADRGGGRAECARSERRSRRAGVGCSRRPWRCSRSFRCSATRARRLDRDTRRRATSPPTC